MYLLTNSSITEFNIEINVDSLKEFSIFGIFIIIFYYFIIF